MDVVFVTLSLVGGGFIHRPIEYGVHAAYIYIYIYIYILILYIFVSFIEQMSLLWSM